MKQNVFLFILCILINLLLGNMGLVIMASDLPFVYPILISIFIIMIYRTVFYRMTVNTVKTGKWRLAGIAVCLSLSALLFACILTSIGTRMAIDGIIVAGLKGIVPLFVFAVIFASPFWVLSALFNFICLIFMKPKF